MSDPGGTCGCCVGIRAMTPQRHQNRPGLPAISYRTGRHNDFVASMRTELSRSAAHPTLANLRTRDDDDPTIALIDAWAMACDVLTFYTERLAAESYLRTATEQSSLQELGRLVAYRLAPGAAAETPLAFALEAPPGPVAPVTPTPGSVPPAVPASVLLPLGLRVQSVPGPGQRPQTFETVEQIEARPGWNAMQVVRTRFVPPHLNQRAAWFAGTDAAIVPGQAILLASDDLVGDKWDVRLVTEVRPDLAADRTYVRWDRGLGSQNPVNRPADAPDAYVLRKRLRVFGHQAPMWDAMDPNFQVNYSGPTNGNDWPGFQSTRADRDGNVIVDLDGSHPDVVEGSWVVLSQEDDTFYREMYKVIGRSELSRAEFAVSGPVTRLVLQGEWHAFGSPREVTVLAVGHRLSIVEEPDPNDVAGVEVAVEGDATAMEPGRRLIMMGRTPGGSPQAQLLALDRTDPAPAGPDGPRTTLTLRTPPVPGFARADCAVLGNVSLATHGETVTEILGSGDARRGFQSFPLHQSPLTYVQASTPSGVASTLTVRVADVAWQELPSLYGTTATDRVFTTSPRPDGGLDVLFGDGSFGRRLPTNSQNVRATYRKGLGSEGNLCPGTLAQLLDRPLGLSGVTNPLPAVGGADPESASRARASIPLPVRTLGRAVSLRDYSDFALAFAGVGLAEASVLPLRGGRTIVVTITGPEGTEAASTTIARLGGTLHEQGDPHVLVAVVPHTDVRFRLALKIAVDPSRERPVVFAAVEAALRAAYAPTARRLGQSVHRSEVIAVAASIPGVVAIDLDRMYRTAVPRLDDQLVAAPTRVGPDGEPHGVELLALADGPLDWVQVMTS